MLVGDLSAVVIAAGLTGEPLAMTVIAGAVLAVVVNANGLYRSRLSLSLLDHLPQLLVSWLAASTVVLVAQAALGNTDRKDWLFVLFTAVMLPLGRAASYSLARQLRRSGSVAHDTLIIGTTSHGRRLSDILGAHPEYGLRPMGYLCAQDEDYWGLDHPLLGRVRELESVIRTQNIGVAVLAYHDVSDIDLVRLVRSCHRLQCELFLIPEFAELHGVNHDTELLWGLPLVRLRRAAHRTVAWRIKRLVDVVISGAAILALLPLLAALAIAVRLEGGPGIIFRQVRVGIDGREFELMKFRSLRPVDESESQTNWNISHDDRLGRVGRLIRRTSLDELPQLVNIMRGEMSLVGPRPERPHFVREFSSLFPSYQSRDRVPCGLTGWAQIHGLRGDTAIDERAEFDNYYIEHWSLWFDVKIMLKTLVSVVKAPGS